MKGKLNALRKMVIFSTIFIGIIIGIAIVSEKKTREWPQAEGDTSQIGLISYLRERFIERPLPAPPPPRPKALIPEPPPPQSPPPPPPPPSYPEPPPPPPPSPPLPPSPPTSQEPPSPLNPPMPTSFMPASPAEKNEHAVLVTLDAERINWHGRGINEKEWDTLIRENRFREAESMLKDILKEDKKSALANYQLGLLYYRQGKIKQALDLLEQADWSLPSSHPVLPELCEIYSLIEPTRAITYFEKLSKGGKIDETTAMGALNAFCILNATRKKRGESLNYKYIQLSSDILDQARGIRTGRQNSSDLDTMTGNLFYLQENWGDAAKFYSRITLEATAPGNLEDKIICSTALGLVYLSNADKERAKNYLDRAYSFLNDSALLPQGILPRIEELTFCIHVLLNQPLLNFHLEKLAKKRNKQKELGLASFNSADEIRNLLAEMEKNRIAEDYDKALTNATQLVSTIDKSGGYFYDVGILQPIFKTSLYIYMGDTKIEEGKKEQAREFYEKALKSHFAVRNVIEQRLKQAGLR